MLSLLLMLSFCLGRLYCSVSEGESIDENNNIIIDPHLSIIIFGVCAHKSFYIPK